MAEWSYRVLVVCTRSGMGKGGLPVFNQHLTESLAKEHEVTLLTAQADTPFHQGVRAVITHEPPWVHKDPNKPPEQIEDRIWLTEIARRSPQELGLPTPDPNNPPFDLIVGHSRFSGPAAVELRDRWYPEARVVHFLHTSPERLPGFKSLSHVVGSVRHDGWP